MDIPLDDIVRFLTPLLPYLIRAGERATDELAQRIAGDAWDAVRAFWARARTREPLRQAAQDLSADPDDPDALAAFRLQLRKAVAADPALAEELAALWKAREVHVYVHHLPPPLPERPRPLHNLPQPDYVRFVGRERELAWLRARLSPSDRAWILLLTGIGGVGKTALALAIAHEYRQRYDELPSQERFDAIVWASAKEQVLTPTGPEAAGPPGLVSHTLAEVYRAIAQALDREAITRAAPEDQDREVQKALTAQRTLLVLDNLDTMDDAVRAFLRNLPAPTKAIVTSRERLDVADTLVVRGMEREEALALIEAEAEPRGLALTPGQKERLYERTAGLPLPIRLSVARLGSGETFERVMRWLGNATGDLPQYCVGGQVELARRRNPDAYRLLLACSLFDRDAGASREALGEIADLSIADRDEGLALLERLNLVNRTADDRFWMLPMVQEYVRASLSGNLALEQELLDRWALWYQKRLAEYPGKPLPPEEVPNITAVLLWLLSQGKWDELSRAENGILVLYNTGAIAIVCQIGHALIEQILTTGSLNLARFSWLLRYSDGMAHHGRLDEFKAQWAKLEPLLTGDPNLIAIKLGIQARLARWEAERNHEYLYTAIQVITRILEELPHLGTAEIAEIQLLMANSLGLLYLIAGEPDQAEKIFAQALGNLTQTSLISSSAWEAILKGNIAIARARRSYYQEARDTLYEILPKLEEKTDRAEAYMLLAVYEYHLGNLPEAIELARKAEQLFDELGVTEPPWKDFEYQEWLKLLGREASN